MDDDCDIFKFRNTAKIKDLMVSSRIPGRPRGGAKGLTKKIASQQSTSSSHHVDVSSSSYSEDYSGDSPGSSGDEKSSPSKARRSYKKSTAASRLLKRKPKKNEEDDADITEQSLPLKKSKTSSDCHDFSLSPSPRPSPPPPGVISLDDSLDSNSGVLNQANDVLNRLYFAPSYNSEVYTDIIETPPSAKKESMNLRVRCKGKIRKYIVEKGDPFSKVIDSISEELKIGSDDKVLLSHKTATIKPTDSPASLGLTTANIIDAVIMADAALAELVLNDSQNSTGGGDDTITIKVQTSNKHIIYSLAKDDPLQKAMTAFAADLNVPISKLKFSFDGETISPTQTAQDLEMENDDCIDVTVKS